MHDTLKYVQLQPVHRRWHHDLLTFGLMYAFTENFLLPLSHDEVVHGKGSLLAKMPGDAWQQFATCARTTRSCGRTRARSCCSWDRSSRRAASGTSMRHSSGRCSTSTGTAARSRSCATAIARYRAQPVAARAGLRAQGFRWIEVNDRDRSVFAWLREGGDGAPPLAAIVNFTPVPRRGLPDRPAAARALARDPQHRRRGVRRQRLRQRRRRRRASPAKAMASRISANVDAAAARRDLARARRDIVMPRSVRGSQARGPEAMRWTR